jgi:hypothetical protein
MTRLIQQKKLNQRQLKMFVGQKINTQTLAVLCALLNISLISKFSRFFDGFFTCTQAIYIGIEL